MEEVIAEAISKINGLIKIDSRSTQLRFSRYAKRPRLRPRKFKIDIPCKTCIGHLMHVSIVLRLLPLLNRYFILNIGLPLTVPRRPQHLLLLKSIVLRTQLGAMALLLLDPPRQLLHLDLVRVVLYHLVLEYGVVLLVNFAPIVFLDDLLLLLPLRHIQIVLALPLGILSQLVSVSLGVGGSLRGGLALTDGAVLALAEDGEVSLLGRNG